MSGYEVLNVGAPNQWRDYFGGFRPESSRDGRRVVDLEMNMQYIGLTVNALTAGEESGYWHKHSVVEEVYVILAGRGQWGLDGNLVEVEAGSVIRLSPDTWVTWRCHPDEPHQLQWICVRAGGTELPDSPNDATVDRDRPMPWEN